MKKSLVMKAIGIIILLLAVLGCILASDELDIDTK